MNPIVVINPNSTQAVTDVMDRALDPLRLSGGPPVECVTLREGPPGIETQKHVDAVVVPICNLIKKLESDVSAFVIGCFSDPAVTEARLITSKPVLGIAESSMLVAMTRGFKFGVVSILENSVVRHRSYVHELGFAARFAGDRPVGLNVTELVRHDQAFERLVEVGRELKDIDDADVLITGCAGMSGYRVALEKSVGLPVIDPVQAAVSLAISQIILS